MPFDGSYQNAGFGYVPSVEFWNTPGNDSVSGLAGRIFNNLNGTTAQNAYNAWQAQVDRDWNLMLSNTAYQRTVADMKAAGINPASLSPGANNNPSQSFSSGMARSNAGGDGGLAGLLGNTISRVLSSGLAASINSAGRKAVADDKNVLAAMTLKAKNELNSAKLAMASKKNDLAEQRLDLRRGKQAEDSAYRSLRLGLEESRQKLNEKKYVDSLSRDMDRMDSSKLKRALDFSKTELNREILKRMKGKR